MTLSTAFCFLWFSAGTDTTEVQSQAGARWSTRCLGVNFKKVTHSDRSSEKGPVLANGIRRGRPLWIGRRQPQPQILEERTGPPAPVDTAPPGPWPGVMQAAVSPSRLCKHNALQLCRLAEGWYREPHPRPSRRLPGHFSYTCFTSEPDPQVTWGSHGSTSDSAKV